VHNILSSGYYPCFILYFRDRPTFLNSVALTGRNTTGPPRPAPGELRCICQCYRRRQTPATVTSLPPTQCVGGPVIKWRHLLKIRFQDAFRPFSRVFSAILTRLVKTHIVLYMWKIYICGALLCPTTSVRLSVCLFHAPNSKTVAIEH